MHSPVKIPRTTAERPLTSNGIHVPKTSHAEREVVDLHYYKSLLRLQIKEIANEIEKMQHEKEGLLEALEDEEAIKQECGELQSRVTESKYELFDVNESIEKIKLKPKDRGFEELELLIQSRELKEQHCMDLLGAKSSLLEMVQEQSSVVSARREELDQFISRMNANERANIKQIRDSNVEIKKEVLRVQEEVREALREEKILESELSKNDNISRMRDLKAALHSVSSRYESAQKDIEILQQPLPEQKEIILQYVKEMNSQTATIETKVKEMLLQLSSLETNSAELRAARKEDSDKFKLIKAKGIEIDSLMIKLEDERGKLDAKVISIQNEIEKAAEDKHCRIKAQSDLTEIKFLETELDASKYTAAQLEVELRLRREEMAKLDKADVTCIKEISDLRADINDLEKKLALSLDVEQLRQNRTHELSQLDEVSKRLEAEETALAKEFETKKSTLQAKLMRLSQNEMHGKLSRVDEKLKFVNDEIAKLSRTLESVQFTKEKQKLGEMIGKVNDLLVMKQLE